MQDSESNAARIEKWILEKFPLARRRRIGRKDSLLENGIIDSLGTLEVVLFLEREFGIRVTDEEMLADHFESINAITRFVEAKRSK